MIWRVWSVKPYVKFHHLKSEPKGSFLMLSIHLSFEEIIADLNSANPTSAISFLKHKLLPVNKIYKNSNFN